MASSKRSFAGRLWAGVQYAVSLFRGTGETVAAHPIRIPAGPWSCTARTASFTCDGRDAGPWSCSKRTASFGDF